ncbi:glutamate receptor U1-like [Haliotis asinina]|uniref:glutamate receptor U1-like n=1 Tax=Haliotis asinina TaxID=109174 RepID=UPI0035322FC4
MLLILFLSTCPFGQTASSPAAHFRGMQDIAPTCDEHVASTLLPILTTEKIKSIIVVYENENDPCLYKFIDDLDRGIKVRLMSQSTFGDQLRSVMDNIVIDERLHTMHRTLNFVLRCTTKCIQHCLFTGMELDIKVGRRSVLRHFSKWILIPKDDKGIAVTDLTFDNVILLNHKKASPRIEIATLMWQHGGRQWNRLHTLCGPTISDGIKVFPNARFGLNGRQLTVLALEWKPFSVKERDRDIVYYSGISGLYIDYLSVRFNFSYKYIEPADGLWGTMEENGSWTGIVGMLQRQEADLCSVPYAMSIERAKVMEFTYPILTEYSTVIYKKMEDENKAWKVLISCFKWDVYVVGGIVLLIVGLMYGCLIKTTPNPYKEVQIMREAVYYNGTIMAIMPPLSEASVDIPVFDSGRILFSCWWLFCLIMVAVYRGNLMAFLAVSRTVVPFSTLEELANQDVYDVGAPVGSYLSSVIESSKQVELKKLWEKIQKTQAASPKSGPEDYQYQVQRLHQGNFAYMQANTVAVVIMNGTCNLAKMKEGFLPTSSSMTFPLHSPLARLFYPEIISAMDRGLGPKWYGSWLPSQEFCSDQSVDVGVSALHIQDYIGAIAASAVGICLAVLALLVENLVSHLRRNVTERSSNYA